MACGGCAQRRAAAQNKKITYEVTYSNGSKDEFDTYAQAIACDSAAFNRFFHAMLERGVYLAPSAFEAGFMSAAHDDAVIEQTLVAAREAFRVAKA